MIKQRDIKLLWGRSGNRCAICKHELSHEPDSGSPKLPIGEQAHIVAEENTGPRGKSPLTIEERNSYANLLLLCPTDHTIIDKDVQSYPIERLHQIKTDHELWVHEKLSGSVDDEQVDRLTYSHLIDKVVADADLINWNEWASYVLEPTPRYPEAVLFRAADLRKEIAAAVWPGTVPDIESALDVFTRVLLTSARIFSEHIGDNEQEGYFYGDRFYRIPQMDHDLYHLRLKEFQAWTNSLDELMREATRAANWLAVSVRKNLNPMFFALEGKFHITDDIAESGSTVYEYTTTELQGLSATITQRLESIVAGYKSFEERAKKRRPSRKRK